MEYYSSNINLSILMKMEYEISYSLIYSEIYEQQLCVNKLQYDWVASKRFRWIKCGFISTMSILSNIFSKN